MHWSIIGIWTTAEVIAIGIVVVVEVTITIYVPYIVSIISGPGPTQSEDTKQQART